MDNCWTEGKKMRNALIVLSVLLCSITSSAAQVSVEVSVPGVNIGFNQPVYPQFVAVPGYPVYYAPQANSNYFFYDGMYWIYQRDNWYMSSWYNGPWDLVSPDVVPLFVLRVPVRYYRQPPSYFSGWSSDASPRWGEHWGQGWDQRRHGWDSWDRASAPAPAPLPAYQRQYSGNRYPRAEQQQALQSQNYRYQPRDAVVQQHYQAQPAQSAPAAAQGKQVMPQERAAPPQAQRASGPPSSPQQGATATQRGQPPNKGGGDVQRSATAKVPQQAGPTAEPSKQQPQQAAAQHPQQTSRLQAQPQAARSQQAAPQQQQQQASRPQAQPQVARQPQQTAPQQQQQASRPQVTNKGPQAQARAPEPKAQQQPQPPPVAAVQHQQQEPKAQSQDKGKPSAQESRPGQEKG
jgi:hypothetical protein